MRAASFARFSDEAADPAMKTESVRPALGFFCGGFETACNWRGGGITRALFCFELGRRKEKEGNEKRRGSLPVGFSGGE